MLRMFRSPTSTSHVQRYFPIRRNIIISRTFEPKVLKMFKTRFLLEGKTFQPFGITIVRRVWVGSVSIVKVRLVCENWKHGSLQTLYPSTEREKLTLTFCVVYLGWLLRPREGCEVLWWYVYLSVSLFVCLFVCQLASQKPHGRTLQFLFTLTVSGLCPSLAMLQCAV